jgi:hypothetical protein
MFDSNFPRAIFAVLQSLLHVGAEAGVDFRKNFV